MKVVYIAGPFTASTPWGTEQNVRRAEALGLEVAQLGAAPMIPHSNTRLILGTCTPELWYEATLALLLKCDAVLMTGNWEASRGATAEHEAARKAGVRVFYGLDGMDRWLYGAPRNSTPQGTAGAATDSTDCQGTSGEGPVCEAAGADDPCEANRTASARAVERTGEAAQNSASPSASRESVSDPGGSLAAPVVGDGPPWLGLWCAENPLPPVAAPEGDAEDAALDAFDLEGKRDEVAEKLLAEKDAEIAALREDLRRAKVLLSPKLTAMEIERGGFTAQIDSKGVMQVFAAAFWDLLVETGAKNFLQVTFDRADRRGDLLVTLQRKDGKTPAELKEEAEAKVVEKDAELETLAEAARTAYNAIPNSLTEDAALEHIYRWVAERDRKAGHEPEGEGR